MTSHVALVMGSSNDWRVMKAAADVLDGLAVPYDAQVLSAHRMPHDMVAFGSSARSRSLRVIVAGAGGAAHLPGMLAAVTTVPVIGVPIAATALSGLDALLSIVQMPRGVPVATVAIDGAANAGLLAAQILALNDEPLQTRLEQLRAKAEREARTSTLGGPSGTPL